jgi:aspartate 1-decarboxylase
MFLKVLRAKIHLATVTAVEPDYQGSILIDQQVCRSIGLHEFESVLVADLNNGTRHETYVIYGPAGSGIVSVNGAAARLVQPGDKVIIMAFGYVQPSELQAHTVKIALMNDRNGIASQVEHNLDQANVR